MRGAARVVSRAPMASAVASKLRATMAAGLKARALDVSIACVPEDGLSDPELTSESPYEDSLCVWANRSHPLAGRARVT
jgi:DNA-binding transcriptional LysR family regulator